jgi:hypothetical protein
MVFRDDEIDKSRVQDEIRQPSKIKSAAAERARRQKIIAGKLQEAKKLNDARAFAEVLRVGGIEHDSKEWKLAWKYFYDRRS